MILVEILLSIIVTVTVVGLLIIPKWKKWEGKEIQFKFTSICSAIIFICEIGRLVLRLINGNNYWMNIILLVLWASTLVIGIVFYYLYKKKVKKDS